MISKMMGTFTRIISCLICVVICALCFVESISAKGSDDSSYVVTLYNEQNGLPTGEANTVLQTSDGYIWIGSYGGLIRYDGTEFRNYSVERAIQSSSIRSLFEDTKGRLWIGTNDAGVVVMENDVFTEIVSPKDRSFSCIRDFAEGKDGTIYVASNSGMAEIADGVLVPYEAEELVGNTVYAVAVDSRERIWGSMNNGDCAVVQDDELLEIITSNMIFEGTDIYSIDSDADGNIVMGSSDAEIAVIEFPTDSLEKKDLHIVRYNTGDVTVHNAVTATDNNYILVSGINGFAVIDPKGKVTEFGEADKAMSVNAAIADYENNIWLASSSYGIIKYSQGCFTTPNAEAKLEGTAINSVTFSDGYWYIGHDTGLIVCDQNWKQISNELTEMFEGIRVRNIITDREGKVWLASYSDFSLVSYNPSDDNIVQFGPSNGLAGDKARVVFELSDGRIVVGTQTGVSVIEDGKITKTYDHKDGMDNPSVLCFSEGKNGEILVGSDGNGIYEITNGIVTNHSFEAGLAEGVVLRMLKDSDNDGYFVSAGSSLYYWENGAFRNLTNFAKDAGSIFDFYERDGMLWILQNNGLMTMDKKELLEGKETDTIHYGLDHGMTGSINANTWNYVSLEGQLYMATRNGISVFGFEGVDNSLPKVMVHSVSVDGRVLEHPKHLVLESGAQRITINFSALSFTDTTELRIAYRLKGFDEETYVTTAHSDSVSYTNLPGGNYTFEVQVYSPENPDEKIEYSLSVTKEKKVTEYVLFWVLQIVVLMLLSVGVVLLYARMKMSVMHRRQQEYKSIVDQSLRTFAKTIDAKDPYTQGHSLRVAQYSRELAKRMGLSPEEQERIYYVALMHDIGKIGVPDYILNKPGKLTDEEMATIQKHVDTGGEILKDFTALVGIAKGAKYHHERYDGKGYTQGLAGEDIPQVARIIGVADSYDAMSSDRCYRKALSSDIIVEELTKYNGTQFDPKVVPHMLAMIEEGIVPMQED